MKFQKIDHCDLLALKGEKVFDHTEFRIVSGKCPPQLKSQKPKFFLIKSSDELFLLKKYEIKANLGSLEFLQLLNLKGAQFQICTQGSVNHLAKVGLKQKDQISYLEIPQVWFFRPKIAKSQPQNVPERFLASLLLSIIDGPNGTYSFVFNISIF